MNATGMVRLFVFVLAGITSLTLLGFTLSAVFSAVKPPPPPGTPKEPPVTKKEIAERWHP